MSRTVLAAAVQATPVFLDRDATVDKVVELTAKAAAEGAGLVVFPEAFVPPTRTGSGARRPGRTAPTTRRSNGRR